MNRAVIGARVHSGWAALLAVSGQPGSPEVIDRRRLAMVDAAVVGANQPYHFAENLNVSDATEYLAQCGAASERVASAALHGMVQDLSARSFRVDGCVILLAAGRPLPALAEILASHALIHTAEGEFFRRILRQASESLGIAVTGIRERDLESQAKLQFGTAASRIQQKIGSLGKSLGPPWTQDQKTAALAACLALDDLC